jgi:ubiquinone/menaquinone biosynthesis C-methylase UbiE
MDLRAGEKVLDVAAGNGNATLAAARRWGDVTSTDYVPALLERARVRAEADGLTVHFQEADAENLPFRDGQFDDVLSTFGVMFTPDQMKAANEMLRVCRSGGRIGLANWTPEGFIGQVFKIIGKYVPPAGGQSPLRWGTQKGLEELFPAASATVRAPSANFIFRYRSAAHWVDFFRSYYGPVVKAFAALDGKGQAALQDDLAELLTRLNRSGDGTLVVPGEYLEVVITKK